MQKAISTSALRVNEPTEKKERTCYPPSVISLPSHATQDTRGV